MDGRLGHDLQRRQRHHQHGLGLGRTVLPVQEDSTGHHLWGFNPDRGGDDAVGVLRSATVTLGGDGIVDLLVSGGNDPDRLYAAVVRASDEKVLAKAIGCGGGQYRRVSFALSGHIGERIYDVNVPVRRG
ncbi:hypothetical protein ABZ499_35500 [Streptomyces sp. NPDC019990]|uniref:hypothetical protein n=1 Tax=Streptomyces sp. NPDC019990 TaxID=3154693 RepID=UPI0033E1E4EF